MIDMTTDLKDRFDFAAYWFLDRHEIFNGIEAELSDEDAKAAEVLNHLRDSVDAIPPSLIHTAEELRTSWPDDFERWFVHGVQCAGVNYFPADATEFVKALNHTVQREKESA